MAVLHNCGFSSADMVVVLLLGILLPIKASVVGLPACMELSCSVLQVAHCRYYTAAGG